MGSDLSPEEHGIMVFMNSEVGSLAIWKKFSSCFTRVYFSSSNKPGWTDWRNGWLSQAMNSFFIAIIAK